MAAPKATSGILTVLVNWILLSYLGPEEFGIYSLCVAAILLTDAIIGSAIDMGVLRLAPLYRATDMEHSLIIEKAALSLKFLLALVACLAVVLFAEPLSTSLFHQKDTAHLLYISAIAATGMLLLRSTLVHLQVERKFALYGVLDFFHNLLKFGGIALILAFYSVRPDTVLVFFAVGPICAFALGLFLFGKKLVGSWRAQTQVASELVDFVKWFLLTFTVAAVVSRLDIFMLSSFSTMREVGIFSGGYVFALIPELLGMYLAIVFSPRIMPYYRDGHFFLFYRSVQIALWAATLVIFVIVLLGIDIITPVLLPASFVHSSDVIVALLPGTLAGMATFPLTVSFLMFIRPKFYVMLDVVMLPVVLILYYYAIQHYGALGAAWITGGSRLTKAAIAQLVAWRIARLPPTLAGSGLAADLAPAAKVFGVGGVP